VQFATRSTATGAVCTSDRIEKFMTKRPAEFLSSQAQGVRFVRRVFFGGVRAVLFLSFTAVVCKTPRSVMNSTKNTQDPVQTFGSGSESTSSIKDAARAAASRVGSAATEAASKIKDRAERLASDQRDVAAEKVEAYGSAVHKTAASLEQEDPNIAWLTHRAADRLEGVANYVRTRDLRGLREDAANLARRHPAAFFGGMAVLGLVLGGVIRAARQGASNAHVGSLPGEQGDYAGTTGEEFSGAHEGQLARGANTGSEI
jgi:hypothetical protein